MSNLNEIVVEQKGSPAPEHKKETKVSKEIEALEVQIKQAELEAKLLEIKERTANVQDMEERLAERDLKRAQKRQYLETKGQVMQQTDRDTRAAQKRCNHKKGGNGVPGVVGGRGDSPQYAILRHTFANGDTWVRCLRCGKTWKPPVKRSYSTQEAYEIAQVTYRQALDFQTNNTDSSSYVFQYSDGGEYYREITESTTLR